MGISSHPTLGGSIQAVHDAQPRAERTPRRWRGAAEVQVPGYDELTDYPGRRADCPHDPVRAARTGGALTACLVAPHPCVIVTGQSVLIFHIHRRQELSGEGAPACFSCVPAEGACVRPAFHLERKSRGCRVPLAGKSVYNSLASLAWTRGSLTFCCGAMEGKVDVLLTTYRSS